MLREREAQLSHAEEKLVERSSYRQPKFVCDSDPVFTFSTLGIASTLLCAVARVLVLPVIRRNTFSVPAHIWALPAQLACEPEHLFLLKSSNFRGLSLPPSWHSNCTPISCWQVLAQFLKRGTAFCTRATLRTELQSFPRPANIQVEKR